MWQQDIQGVNSFDDLEIKEQRLPVIKKLETALLNSKPKSTLFFIKKWAQKQMKEIYNSDDEDQHPISKIDREKIIRGKQCINPRRRNAIVMAKIDQNEQSCTFQNKQSFPMNEQCKSKIMLSLKQIPFLVNLGWEEINQLVDSAKLKQYMKEEMFASKGQTINKIYIVIHGSIRKEDRNNKIKLTQGSILFMQSIVNINKVQHNYIVESDKGLICGIQAFNIYQTLQLVSQKKEAYYEKILMGVNLFHCLDKQEFYKIICMVKQVPVKKANEIIVQKHSLVDRMFLVLRGQFLLCKYNLINEIVSFQSFKEGNTFGENWITHPTEAECSVVSNSEGLLGYLVREDIQKAIAPISRLAQRKKVKQIDY